MKPTIRKAEKQDMPAVLDLIKELAVFEKEPDAVEVSIEDLEKDGFGNDPKFYCFVAEVDLKIVGMAFLYFRYSTWKGKTVHLEDLIVQHQHRGKGYGLALYKKVMQFAAENNVKRVEWVVLDWNKSAIDFYEKSGATVFTEWNTVQMNEDGLQQFLKSNS